MLCVENLFGCDTITYWPKKKYSWPSGPPKSRSKAGRSENETRRDWCQAMEAPGEGCLGYRNGLRRGQDVPETPGGGGRQPLYGL